MATVIRTIDGFHQDDVGDWVAELSCLHGQHVRHRPPFQDRPWVLTEDGRGDRVGTAIECPLCDRAELPDGLVVARTAGPFDEVSLPAALRRAHRVAERTWGRLRVLEGAVRLTIDTSPAITVDLDAGGVQAIPPTVSHALTVDRPGRLEVDFLVRPAG
jgi:tellurite methyltransferase